jgi:hypothetical protein
MSSSDIETFLGFTISTTNGLPIIKRKKWQLNNLQLHRLPFVFDDFQMIQSRVMGRYFQYMDTIPMLHDNPSFLFLLLTNLTTLGVPASDIETFLGFTISTTNGLPIIKRKKWQLNNLQLHRH